MAKKFPNEGCDAGAAAVAGVEAAAEEAAAVELGACTKPENGLLGADGLATGVAVEVAVEAAGLPNGLDPSVAPPRRPLNGPPDVVADVGVPLDSGLLWPERFRVGCSGLFPPKRGVGFPDPAPGV